MNQNGTGTLATILAAPFVLFLLAAPASATTHVDPCVGNHVTVWSEVGNSGAGQATNHFVCGQVGQDGKDGTDGKDGEQGPKGETGAQGPAGSGEAGPAGAPGAQGPAGPAGADGVAGPAGPMGPAGNDGAAGANGATGARGPEGLKGEATSSTGAPGVPGKNGKDGKNGITKTVIVHPDGTTEVVPNLPATGSDATTYWLAGLGVGLTALGAATVLAYRKRK